MTTGIGLPVDVQRTAERHIPRPRTAGAPLTLVPAARRTEQVFDGVPIAETTPEAAVEEVLDAVRHRRGEVFRSVNAFSLALATKQADYKSLLAGRGVNFPDGRPLAAVLARMTTGETCAQVRGPSLFENVLAAGRTEGVRHFFLGTSDETLGLLRANVESRFPGVELVGMHAPPFRPLTDEDYADHDRLVRESGAQIVWVGMGTPRQDFEARRLAESTGVVAIGVGAAFDFTAGVKRTAPEMMHRMGLEWLFRLASEPRRLGARYAVGNSIFLRLAVRHWLSA